VEYEIAQSKQTLFNGPQRNFRCNTENMPCASAETFTKIMHTNTLIYKDHWRTWCIFSCRYFF